MKYSRKDYLANRCSHEEYYGQFVTREWKRLVTWRIGKQRILASKDESFNDIPLQLWDALEAPYGTIKAFEKVGDFLTLAGKVCLAKEAARQIKEDTQA